MYFCYIICKLSTVIYFVLIVGFTFLCILVSVAINDKIIRSKREEEEENRIIHEKYLENKRLRIKALSLAKKYPEATKLYFKIHWGIIKSNISPDDITYDKVDILLSHESSYESDELKLNEAYKAKILAEQNEKKRKEMEKFAFDAISKAFNKRKEKEVKELLILRAKCWDILYDDFHYSYLLNYYPTTCNFEASEKEWEDRWTVWNFKNTPGRISPQDHEKTLNIVVEKIKRKLIFTFEESYLKYITFVCIPASTAAKTKARYEDFSNRLCMETGMSNAYNHMEVLNASDEKKFGGSGINTNNVSFDSNYFRGRYVILFDDIITKGESMLRFKRKMEELGAIVLCGISIGKTKHSR